MKPSFNLDSLNISTRLMAEAAKKRGYELTYHPASKQTQTGVMHCIKGSTSIAFKSTATHLTPSFGYFVAEDKLLTHSLLTQANIPTPYTQEIKLSHIDFTPYDFGQKTYVIKPVAMNHGDGVSMNISAPEQAIEALRRIQSIDPETAALIQEQVTGEEFRFLVLRGKVIAVAHRQPAFVIGDGKHTVQELVELKNQDPRRADGHASTLTKINIDDVAIDKDPSFLRVTPQAQEKIVLLSTSNLSKGGEATDFTEQAHQSLKEIAVNAAQACTMGLAGVDIITDNITNPTPGKSYVIELNLAPGLRMHHFPSQGLGRDVAGMIFKELENTVEYCKNMTNMVEYADG